MIVTWKVVTTHSVDFIDVQTEHKGKIVHYLPSGLYCAVASFIDKKIHMIPIGDLTILEF